MPVLQPMTTTMKELFKKYLFNKHILVEENEPDAEESFNTIVALKNKFGIKPNHLEYCSGKKEHTV